MKKKACLKGSSLIEVLVSLVIISIVISLATGSYFRITIASTDKTSKRMIQLEKIAENALHTGDYQERRYILSDGTIAIQQVKPYHINNLLYVYELKTQTDNKKESLALRKIILKTNE